MSISEEHNCFVRDVVHRESGNVLDDDAVQVIESRLDALARSEGLASHEDVIARARQPQSNGLRAKIVDTMTTKETSFFRDVRPFSVLSRKLLPELAASSPNESINILSAGCSSGQEPYSIAISVLESLPTEAVRRVRIHAGDLSDNMIRRAEAGCYSRMEVNRGLHTELLEKYFTRENGHWVISAGVRQLVEFYRFNLAERWPPFPMMDVIFLRNVLIYFADDERGGIMSSVRKALKPNGVLFLGCAETTCDQDESFERLQEGQACYYRLRKG